MNKKDLKMRPVGNEYLEQYNALLRYVFQVTDQELSSVGWQEKEIIRAKFPTMQKADVIGWFDGDTLVSQVAVYPMRVKVFGKTYSMGGLTGVGTYPEYSNMGLMHKLLEQALIYGRINLIALPFYVLQYEFQCLFATAEKPRLGLFVTVAAGVANMVLDALFVGVFSWGAAGAAAATAISQCIGGVAPLIYFARPNSSLLRLGKCRLDLRALGKTCSNGSSEFMSNVSMSLVSMLYNVQLMKYAGEDGISAYGVLMYVSMVFQAIFVGYSVGVAPIESYHLGAENRRELRGLLRRSLGLLAVCAACMFAAGQVLAAPLSRLYVGYDPGLFEMTSHAFGIFSFSFLFSGFAIYGSSFFTALNDGLTSAIIAFLRTLVFQVGAVLLFPLLWRLDGIWMSIVAAEVMAVITTAIFLVVGRKRYGY